MVDTLVLLLNPSAYQIINPDAFTPSARWVLNNTITPGIISKQNATKRELRAGIYKPYLTLAHRANIQSRLEIMLKIELSLPKLLFGNNFDELHYKDFATITDKLTTLLYDMGITTTAHALAQAPVAAIHYAKNMAFTDGSTPHYYINKIKEAQVPLALDINQTDYRNDGHSYKLHSNAYEVVFYDKIRDLEKAKRSEKRAIEKDNALQLNVLKSLRTDNKKLEVLRMEVRLNKRQKMKQLFDKLGIKAELTFKKLFKPLIAKTILLHYLEELERKRPPLLDYTQSNDKALLIDLITHNPDFTLKQIMSLFGLKQALEIMTPRELRTMFPKSSTRSWNRLMVDASKVKLQRRQSIFGILREHVEQFKALRILTLQKVTVNWEYKLAPSNEQISHYIYLDNGVFRKLKKDIVFLKNFNEWIKKEYPTLFKNIDFIFTWGQLLEEINLGTVINLIVESEEWENKINNENILPTYDPKIKNLNEAICNSINQLIEIIYKIIKELPKLQKTSLLNEINKSLKIAHNQANFLIEHTLTKAKNFILFNDHIEDLAYYILGKIMSCNKFKNLRDWKISEPYFNILIHTWHKLCMEKNIKLDLYPLLERRYYSDPKVTQNDPLQLKLLKSNSDMCDGEMPTLSGLGYKQKPVISITFDEHIKIEKQISIMKESLTGLNRDVIGWSISSIPGKIICLNKKEYPIENAHIIPFDTPFAKDIEEYYNQNHTKSVTP